MLRFVFFSLSVFTVSCSLGVDFYIDSKLGNDQQAGTSLRTPWKSLEKVNEAKLQPGDRVLFRSDGIWNGNLQVKSGMPGKPITYTSFGRGEKPSFRNSMSLNKSNLWITAGDNLWASKPTTVSVSKTSRPAMGAKLVAYQRKELKGRSEKIMQGGVQGMRFVCTETGEAFYHRQLFFLPLSVEEGKRYLFRFKARSSLPFVLRAGGFSLESDIRPYAAVGTKEAVTCEIKSDWNEYNVVFNCEKTETNARVTIHLGATVPSGGVLEIVPVGFGELETDSLGLDDGVANLFFNGNQAGVRKNAMELLREQGDFLFDWEKSRILLFSKRNPVLVFNRIEAVFPAESVVDLSKRKHVVLDGLDIRYSGGHGIRGDEVSDVTIRNCDISRVGGGSTDRNRPDNRAGNGIEFYGNAENILVESCRIGDVFGVGIGMVGTGQHRKKHVVIRGNTIWNCDLSIGFYPETKIETLILEDNTCHAAGFGWGPEQQDRIRGVHFLFERLSGDSKAFVIKGNRLSVARNALIEIGGKFSPSMAKTIRCDQNTFWQPESETIVSFEDTNFTADGFTEYQKKTGWDAGSQINEESFTRPSF